ncbi:zinc finger protein 723-like [Protopterus annectens]|uniref:zinc finger protein 723-like n=1 Tax=Protopterus annectens TaxID=7888 RepID=UPI001CFB2001|nr:zinc finger protein 723-like [Protopterus annectens]
MASSGIPTSDVPKKRKDKDRDRLRVKSASDATVKLVVSPVVVIEALPQPLQSVDVQPQASAKTFSESSMPQASFSSSDPLPVIASDGSRATKQAPASEASLLLHGTHARQTTLVQTSSVARPSDSLRLSSKLSRRKATQKQALASPIFPQSQMDKIKTNLTSLESKLKEFNNMQSHHENGIGDIKEDVFNLEKYIKQQFAELHQFLLDKEEQLIQQLKNVEENTLKWMEGNLECIKQEIVTYLVTDSDGNLEDKIKEEDSLKIMEENVKSVENDAMAINSISHSNMEIRQPEPVGLLTVPETFEDVTVTFTEEEWKLLRKQDKELYRDVMEQNYETCVSVGYKIPPKKLLQLFKADEVPKDVVMGINITKQKDHFEDNSNSMKRADCNVNRSQQPALLKTQLHHPTRNVQQRSQPGKDSDEVYVTCVPQLPSDHHCHQTPELDNGTPAAHHQTEHLPLHTQPVKVCDELSRTPSPRLHSGHGCSRSSECNTGTPAAHHLTEHLPPHTQPVKACDELSLTPTPTLHSGHGGSRSSECDTTKRFHTKKETHKCAECSKAFTRASGLKQHQAIHTGLKPYKCAECSKCYTQLGSLRKHYAIHTGLKPYKCTECSKCFTQLSSLRKHYAIHTGLKPYKCTLCRKCFTQLSHLQSHHAIHTGTKPHKCTECGKSFKWASSMKRHQVIHT